MTASAGTTAMRMSMTKRTRRLEKENDLTLAPRRASSLPVGMVPLCSREPHYGQDTEPQSSEQPTGAGSTTLTRCARHRDEEEGSRGFPEHLGGHAVGPEGLRPGLAVGAKHDDVGVGARRGLHDDRGRVAAAHRGRDNDSQGLAAGSLSPQV